MTQPFYITGGTLSRDALSYVTRQADTELFQSLLNGNYCYVLTSRQMGKSSLMVRTATALRAEGVRCIVLDLTGIGQNVTVEQWYDGLLNMLAPQVGLEDELEEFWLDHQGQGPLQRWMRALREVVLPRTEGKIVIFIDEIDAVRSLPFSADEFFAGIRECFNRRTEQPEYQRLTFCLLGVATPADLIRDTRTTPFNIGTRIELHDFTSDESGPLSTGIHKGMAAGEMLLERILHWTHGHPYLTQRLCRAVQEDPNAFMPHDVDRLCETLFFTVRSQEQDDNLLFVRERLLRSETDLAGLLHLYSKILRGKVVRDDDLNPSVDVLRLSGIARSNHGRLVVRNRIYDRVFDLDWVKRNMPDAEMRRQRTAYRRGLVRAAAGFGMVALVMGGLAITALRQAGRANQLNVRVGTERDRANRLAYDVNMNLVQSEWDADRVTRAVDVLTETANSPERGFEWYYWFRQCQLDLPEATGRFDGFTFSRDRRNIVTGEEPSLRDAASLKLIAPLPFSLQHVGFKWSNMAEAAVSLNGNLVAARNGFPGVVNIWRRTDGKRTFLKAGGTEIDRIEFSNDGSRLASISSEEGSAKLWDTATGLPLVTSLKDKSGPEKGRAIVQTIALSPDGIHFAITVKDGVNIGESATGQTSTFLKMPVEKGTVLSFAGDGSVLFTWSMNFTQPKGLMHGYDGTLRRWDVASGKLIGVDLGFRFPFFVSQDRRFVATEHLARDNKVRVTSVYQIPPRGGPLVKRWAKSAINAHDFSSDGNWIVASNDMRNIAEVRESLSGKVITRFKGRTKSFTQLAFLPGDTTILGNCDRSIDNNMPLKVWDVASREPISVQPRWCRILGSIVSADCSRAALWKYTTIEIEDAETGKPTLTIPGVPSGPLQMALSPNGKWLVYVNAAKEAVTVNTDTGNLIGKPLTIPQQLYGLAISPDGTQLLMSRSKPDPKTGSSSVVPNGSPEVWSTITCRRLFTIEPVFASLFASFTLDGSRIVTKTDNSNVAWSTATGKPVGYLPDDAQLLCYSDDGERTLLRFPDGKVKIWSVARNREIATLNGKQVESRTPAAFSPDGTRVVTGGPDVRVWDAVSGRETLILKAQASDQVAFSLDGSRIIAIGEARNYIRSYQMWQAATASDVAKWNAWRGLR